MLNQDPRQADFVLGSCPECQKVVRIPVTAVTSQSKSQVRCPICDSSFEIADILDETIPSVEVVDDVRPSNKSSKPAPEKTEPTPERINAIDTPELFHVSKDDYRPKTEKKNGRFVVPELLSKGIKKKKRKGSRRRSRSHEDPKLKQSLEKLKQNTSSTSLNASVTDETASDQSSRESGRSRSDRHESSRRGRSEGRSRGNRSEKSRSREAVRSTKKSPSFFSELIRTRSLADLRRLFRSTMAGMNKKIDQGEMSKHQSKLEYIMIGIGMLLAIPMLHLVMWWFAGVDPLGLAKPTSYVVPFIVPNELQAKVGTDEVLETSASSSERDGTAATRAYQSSTELKMIDGKLPKPKLDPASVHSDDY